MNGVPICQGPQQRIFTMHSRTRFTFMSECFMDRTHEQLAVEQYFVMACLWKAHIWLVSRSISLCRYFSVWGVMEYGPVARFSGWNLHFETAILGACCTNTIHQSCNMHLCLMRALENVSETKRDINKRK